MRNGMKVALLAALMSLTALAAAAQAMHFSAWASAQKIDEIGGNSPELNTPFQERLPDSVPGRAEPVHRLDPPALRRGHEDGPRHLGCPACERRCPLGRTGQPGRAGQLDGGRLLPDARPRQGPLLREPQDDGR